MGVGSRSPKVFCSLPSSIFHLPSSALARWCNSGSETLDLRGFCETGGPSKVQFGAVLVPNPESRNSESRKQKSE